MHLRMRKDLKKLWMHEKRRTDKKPVPVSILCNYNGKTTIKLNHDSPPHFCHELLL